MTHRIYPQGSRSPKQALQGPLLYWMDRDRRLHDNPALVHAQKLATAHAQPLLILYVAPENFIASSRRTQKFMLDGLSEVADEAPKWNLFFELRFGEVVEEVLNFIKEHKVAHVVTDFSPMKVARTWRKELLEKLESFEEVDAHNILPPWLVSDKVEFSAATLRPKLHRGLSEALAERYDLERHPHPYSLPCPPLPNIANFLEKIPNYGPEISWIQAGEKAAKHTLSQFLNKKSSLYEKDRNDPNKGALSNLSPYLHYGMIFSLKIVQEALLFADQDSSTIDSFVEELFVRRELAENYVFYHPDAGTFQGFHAWAQKSLHEHREDPREYLYSLEEFEQANTHDELWNACQNQMIQTGKMHGYMRMYWAKKILEWSASPEEALGIALLLNDRYELDGRDPNGIVGCAWSIGGVHDRAWTERPVYGKIRYMNRNGCARKFNIQSYMDTWNSLTLL